MKPDSAQEEIGLRAYESARAFEALQRRRLPWLYSLAVVIFAACGLILLNMNQLKFGLFLLVAAIWFAFTAWSNWRSLKKRYLENLALLAQLEAQFGEDLPWLKIERHLAEVQALRAADERQYPSDP